ncbi:MAG: pyrroline-5-carboxylate reductase [Huintestinicola sp.]
MVNVGFIGAGNMGTAIIKGILGTNNSDIAIYAYDSDKAKLDELCKIGVSACGSEAEVAEKCKYVLLAVKPQVIDTVLKAISEKVTEDTVLISIAAGIPESYIKSMTIPQAKVVLVMPNTPLLLGEGASALSKAEPTTDDEFAFVKSIFDSCGKTAVISTDKMKEIIAVNGSSPAFIYLFAKAFTDYAKSAGIDENTAKELFSQSLIGSAKMITDSGYTLDELIKMVSSPGGTTLAGLDELYKGKMTETVIKACESCTKRAYELSK